MIEKRAIITAITDSYAGKQVAASCWNAGQWRFHCTVIAAVVLFTAAMPGGLHAEEKKSCTEVTTSPDPARWFVPKSDKTNWYRRSKLRQKRGTLSGSGRFEIKKQGRRSIEIWIDKPKRQSGYVRNTDGYSTTTEDVIVPTGLISSSVRSPLQLWFTIDRLRAYLTGKQRADLIEMRGQSWPERIQLTILETQKVYSEPQKKCVSFAKVALRYIPAAKAQAMLATVKAQRHRVWVIVDTSGSMVPIGQLLVKQFASSLSSDLPAEFKNVDLGAMFFRGVDKGDEFKRIEPQQMSKSLRAINAEIEKFGGGDHDSEPLLDVLYHVSTGELLRTKKRKRNRGKRRSKRSSRKTSPPVSSTTKVASETAIVFTSVDVHPKTLGLRPYDAPRDLDTMKVIDRLRAKGVYTIVAQATPEPGPNMEPFLNTLTSAGKTAFRVIRFEKHGGLLAAQALRSHILNHDADEARKVLLNKVAKLASNVGGLPLVPTQSGEEKFSKIAKAIPAPKGHKWIHITAWMSLEGGLLEKKAHTTAVEN